MGTATLIPTTCAPPPVSHLTEDAQELMERLERFPVRLEPGVLATIMELHDRGESTVAISTTAGLHPLVVILEVRRELDRRRRTPALTVKEWNGLAAGTHVPNKQLRDMIDLATLDRPCLNRTSIIRDADIKDDSQGHRLLGYRPYAGYTRCKETITCEHAERVALALDRAPAEVIGL